jgi:hypothetical protein
MEDSHSLGMSGTTAMIFVEVGFPTIVNGPGFGGSGGMSKTTAALPPGGMRLLAPKYLEHLSRPPAVGIDCVDDRGSRIW